MTNEMIRRPRSNSPERRRVVVADLLHPEGMEILSRSGHEIVQCADPGRRAELMVAVAEASGLIVRSATSVDASLLAAAPHLRVIGRAGVGLDHIDLEAASRRGIQVLNTPSANTVSAAEHTVGLLLAVARRVAAADQELKQGSWARREPRGFELQGKTLGVVGLGRIGSSVALRLQAFGMRVIANDPYLDEERFVALGVERMRSVEQLAAASDVLTIHTPLNSETQGILSAALMAKMPAGSILLNCARGGLLDEAALFTLLEEGRLWGAGLDVFQFEPGHAPSLSSAEPAASFRQSPSGQLAAHPRVVATPHVGAFTVEAQIRMSTQIAAAVVDALRPTG
jgi:D-3-phosphoglycerate dehydrogenase